MKCWLCVVTVQLITKSYPYQVKCRVQASAPATAARKATKNALRELRRVVKGRRLQSMRVDLTNLGPVQVGSKLESVHHDEARV